VGCYTNCPCGKRIASRGRTGLCWACFTARPDLTTPTPEHRAKIAAARRREWAANPFRNGNPVPLDKLEEYRFLTWRKRLTRPEAMAVLGLSSSDG
jgi:hypothetical protein